MESSTRDIMLVLKTFCILEHFSVLDRGAQSVIAARSKGSQCATYHPNPPSEKLIPSSNNPLGSVLALPHLQVRNLRTER